jgi:hypothetical protein
VEKQVGGMNTNAKDRHGLATAIWAVTLRDVYLSIGLAAIVMALTSVIGRV